MKNDLSRLPLFSLIDGLVGGDIVWEDRPSVWDENRRRDLLDSIRRGFPMGSLVFLRTQIKRDAAQKGGGPWTYVIDGHERVATLLSALVAPAMGLGWSRRAFYDLRRQEFAYDDVTARARHPWVMPTTRQEFAYDDVSARARHPWVMPTTAIRTDKSAYDFARMLRKREHTTEANRVEVLRHQFANYCVPIITVVTDSVEDIQVMGQRLHA